jgi:DNA-binding GntR family transcriptional regulator
MLDVSLPALAKVTRPLLRDEAYERIRRAIIDGTLPPGTALRDADLAEQLGLSRAPVRQALLRLAEDGLVDSKPQSYTRVAEFVASDVKDARQVTRLMHEFAVRQAMTRFGPAEIARMRAANERFAAAIDAGDVAAAVVADDELHDVPVGLCGNRAVAATIDRYTPLLRRLEYARFSSALGRKSIRRHTKLIDAIEAGDTDTAVAVVSTIWTDLDLEES